MSTTLNAIHYLPICNCFVFHLNSSVKCNIMHYVLALVLSRLTITSFVPCYAPHVPQHVAVSLFGPLNQIVISSAPSAETDFAYLD